MAYVTSLDCFSDDDEPLVTQQVADNIDIIRAVKPPAQPRTLAAIQREQTTS